MSTNACGISRTISRYCHRRQCNDLLAHRNASAESGKCTKNPSTGDYFYLRSSPVSIAKSAVSIAVPLTTKIYNWTKFRRKRIIFVWPISLASFNSQLASPFISLLMTFILPWSTWMRPQTLKTEFIQPFSRSVVQPRLYTTRPNFQFGFLLQRRATEPSSSALKLKFQIRIVKRFRAFNRNWNFQFRILHLAVRFAYN